jgi:hypothetical protein
MTLSGHSFLLERSAEKELSQRKKPPSHNKKIMRSGQRGAIMKVVLALVVIACCTTSVQVAAQGVLRGQEESGYEQQRAKSRILKRSMKGMRKGDANSASGSGKMMMKDSTATMKGMRKGDGKSASGRGKKFMMGSPSLMILPTPTPVALSSPPPTMIPVDTGSSLTILPTASPVVLSTPPPTTMMIPVDTDASRALWNEIDTAGAYPWPASDSCLGHPLFFSLLNGFRASPYEDLAQALTVLFQDSRMTIALLQGMVVSNGFVGQGNCGRVFDYAKTLETTSDLLVSVEIGTALQEAREEMELRFGSPVPTLNLQPQEDPGRALWQDIDGGIYPWDKEFPCIQPPTYRGGSVTAYTAAAVSLTKAFQDARLTAALDEQIVFNIFANIPPSNCAPMTVFSRDALEQSGGLTAGDSINKLTAARMAFEERIAM